MRRWQHPGQRPLPDRWASDVWHFYTEPDRRRPSAGRSYRLARFWPGGTPGTAEKSKRRQGAAKPCGEPSDARGQMAIRRNGPLNGPLFAACSKTGTLPGR